MELNTREMDKQAQTRRAKRLKRKLKHTLEGAFKHFEENRHLEIKTLVKTDVKRTLRRFYKQEARRPGFDQFGRIYDTAAGMADIQLGAKPDDWVLGKDGKYVWDENVTYETDPDLNGRKYIGAGKYDGWNHAYKNRSWLEKQMGWGPDNVNWNGWNGHVIKNTVIKLAEMQANVEMIPFSKADIDHAKRTGSILRPEFTNFGKLSLDSFNKALVRPSRQTRVKFDLSVGDGETVPIKVVFEHDPSNYHIDRFATGANQRGLTFSHKYNSFSFIFGHSTTDDVFIININSGQDDDQQKLKDYLGTN